MLWQYLIPVEKHAFVIPFKSSEDIQKKEDGPDRPVFNKKISSVTLNELAIKARESIL